VISFVEAGKQAVLARREMRVARKKVKQLPVEMLQQCAGWEQLYENTYYHGEVLYRVS
jgi:hypothetical protein